MSVDQSLILRKVAGRALLADSRHFAYVATYSSLPPDMAPIWCQQVGEVRAWSDKCLTESIALDVEVRDGIVSDPYGELALMVVRLSERAYLLRRFEARLRRLGVEEQH